MLQHHRSIYVRKGAASRYIVAVVLLIAVIAGIAWVAQYLPSVRPAKDKPNPSPEKTLLTFTPRMAVWTNEAEKKGDNDTKGGDPFKEVEWGETGHYDFLFKNDSGSDVDILGYSSNCACTSVKASLISADEFTKVSKHQSDKPGDPLPFASEPSWHELSKDLATAKSLRVKKGEAGVVRVAWNANKAPGQLLDVKPAVLFTPAGDPSRREGRILPVPIMIRPALYFSPQLLHVGVLDPKANVMMTKKEMYAWSSTRDKLNLKLATAGSDPLFVIETTPLSKQECQDLETELRAKEKDSLAHVRSGVRVTVTVHHEKEKGQQLDQGSFYRKLAVYLDDQRVEMEGPELIGRVEGDIVIGGADDLGKIRLKAFEKAHGTIKTIELSAPENLELKTYDAQPSWVQVSLTEDKKNRPPKKRIWKLEVSIPPDTPSVRSLVEPDAVTLRIVGPTERFLRIPIEGHVGGR